MQPPPAEPEVLHAARRVISDVLEGHAAEDGAVAGFERVDDDQWFVRIRGEEKATFSALFVLDQRTVRYESYLMPDPEEGREAVYAYLLRMNLGLYGLSIGVGDENAIYLGGRLDVRHVTSLEMDRILGAIYAVTERCFRPAMRLGFPQRFSG